MYSAENVSAVEWEKAPNLVVSIYNDRKDCTFWVFIITIKTTHFLRRNFRLTLPSPNSVRSLLSWENREKERRRSLKIFNYWVGPKNWTSLRQTCHNQASLPSFTIVVIIVPIIIVTLAVMITIASFYCWFYRNSTSRPQICHKQPSLICYPGFPSKWMMNHDRHFYYCRIPALSWLSAGQLDGMNDSVLTQVSSYLLLLVCFNTLILFLFLSSRAIDLHSINIRIFTITTIAISSNIINMSAVDEHWEDLNLARNRPGQLRQHHRGHARQVLRQVEISFKLSSYSKQNIM